MKKKYALILLCLVPMWVLAQVGEHRNQFAVGFQGGYSINKVDFVPTVSQNNYKGLTGGLVARYTCEKYFKTICSIQMELLEFLLQRRSRTWFLSRSRCG